MTRAFVLVLSVALSGCSSCSKSEPSPTNTAPEQAADQGETAAETAAPAPDASAPGPSVSARSAATATVPGDVLAEACKKLCTRASECVPDGAKMPAEQCQQSCVNVPGGAAMRIAIDKMTKCAAEQDCQKFQTCMQ